MQQTQQTIDTPHIVPVFPLPNTVFFPRTSLPLHIFEPRYRAMVRDVSKKDRLIAVALAEGNEFHTLGTIGRIRDLEPLEDGRFNLRLEGLQRVEMSEVECRTSYRQVRAEPRPEHLTVNDPAALEQAKLDLLAAIGFLRSLGQPQGRAIVLQQELPFEVVVNSACSGLPIEATLRQGLLEEDDLSRRERLLSEYLGMVVDAITQLTAPSSGGDTLPN